MLEHVLHTKHKILKMHSESALLRVYCSYVKHKTPISSPRGSLDRSVYSTYVANMIPRTNSAQTHSHICIYSICMHMRATVRARITHCLHKNANKSPRKTHAHKSNIICTCIHASAHRAYLHTVRQGTPHIHNLMSVRGYTCIHTQHQRRYIPLFSTILSHR